MQKPSWIIALSLVSAASFAAEKTIDPGLYEVVTKGSVGGTQTARKCMTPTDIANGFQNSDLPKDCKATRSVVAGGRLDFATTCPDMTMTMTGSYTSTGYVIDGKVKLKGDDDPMTIESHIVGRKIADTCKAG